MFAKFSPGEVVLSRKEQVWSYKVAKPGMVWKIWPRKPASAVFFQ